MRAMPKHIFAFLPFLAFTLLAACTPNEEADTMTVFLDMDNRRQTYAQLELITVGEFLAQIDVELQELDRVSPPLSNQISDGLRITVVRVEEETYCEERPIPYEEEYVTSEDVPPGEERLVQAGQDGVEQVCYRMLVEDGVRQAPIQTGQPNIITAPQNELYYVGPTTSLDAANVNGTIVYLNNGNVWVMRGTSAARRRITDTGDIEASRAFSLSADGQRLLVTRPNAEEAGTFGNQLWLIPDVRASQATLLGLRPTNVLYAEWVPGRSNVIAYSRAAPRSTSPGWGAFNDLWLTRIDPETGDEISIEPLIEEASGSGGPYGWWGRGYAWSPDGTRLAWIHADAVGLVDLESGTLQDPLASFPVFTPFSDWSWRTSVSWSPDGELIVFTSHGPSVGNEPPDRSPVFDLAFASADDEAPQQGFSAVLQSQVGMWSFPRFSPYTQAQVDLFPSAYIAYMQARRPLDSVSDSAEYDLWVADRDGSNARRLFPDDSQPGIRSRAYAWSPLGDEIVVIYQGNLWLIRVDNGVTRQLTLDGNVTHIAWAQ